MSKKDEKVKVNWLEDAYGTSSCHFNDFKGRASHMAKDTYIGEVYLRGGFWHSKLLNEDEPVLHRTQALAKKHVMDSVDGETVDAYL